jgi:hypothetical protein
VVIFDQIVKAKRALTMYYITSISIIHVTLDDINLYCNLVLTSTNIGNNLIMTKKNLQNIMYLSCFFVGEVNICMFHDFVISLGSLAGLSYKINKNI